MDDKESSNVWFAESTLGSLDWLAFTFDLIVLFDQPALMGSVFGFLRLEC